MAINIGTEYKLKAFNAIIDMKQFLYSTFTYTENIHNNNRETRYTQTQDIHVH